jgi:hypothetical protein
MVTATREMTYEETIADIKNSLGHVPGFMKLMPTERLVREWPEWKCVGLLDIERASCLLCTDTVPGSRP